jgi:Cu(I)-responsive transcriptional regulator
MALSLQIGDLARSACIPAATIRYYEKIGLLGSPARSEGNYRRYGQVDLDRLSFVRRARELGFSIEQVKDLLNLADRQEEDCGSVVHLAQAHLADIEHKINDLSTLRQRLSRLVSSCKGGKVADCRILDALSPADSEAKHA